MIITGRRRIRAAARIGLAPVLELVAAGRACGGETGLRRCSGLWRLAGLVAAKRAAAAAQASGSGQD
jgi:hypothetical protein